MASGHGILYALMVAVAILLSMVDGRAHAADFQPGPSVTIQVARPAAALLPSPAISIKFRQEGIPFRDSAAVKLAIEASLAGTYTLQANAGQKLEFAVAHVDPVAVSNVTLKEERKVKTGVKTTRRRFFRTTREDEFEQRQFTVQYWQARGTLRVLITVRDNADVLLDSFEAQGSCERKVETAVDGVSTNHGILPSPDSLQAEMIADLARAVRARYARTMEPAQVMLAAGRPLDEANVLAANGQWDDAINAWFGTPENTPGRAYNLAVGHEALAYRIYHATGDATAARKEFQQAVQHYDAAGATDPALVILPAKDRCVRRQGAIESALGNAHFQLACAYASHGKSGEAVRHIRDALAAGFSNRQSLASDPRLESIRHTSPYRDALRHGSQTPHSTVEAPPSRSQ